MKKSTAVPATFCASVATLILSGCSSPVSVRRCVDPATGTVLPDVACSSPVTAATYRGGRYARVPMQNGSVCVDTTTNQPVGAGLCTSSSGYYPGYYYYGSRLYRSPGWGYGGVFSGGRISNFSSSPPSGATIHSSSGSVVSTPSSSSSSSSGVSRGGFGSSGSSGSSSGG